jgi:hypothetical protein
MRWLRTSRKIVPWLVGLFMVAQFAGVVPFREAFPSAAVGHTHAHEHAAGVSDTHKHANDGAAHHHHDDDASTPGDECCALHSFAAIVPAVLTAAIAAAVGKPLEDRRLENIAGITPSRLDRPPRTLPLI